MFNLGARQRWVFNSTPKHLYLRQGDRVGPRAGLDGCGEEKNLSLHRGFEPLDIQPTTSRYTDYTTPHPVYQKRTQKSGFNFAQKMLLDQQKYQGAEAVREEIAVYFEKCKTLVSTRCSRNVKIFVTFHMAHAATAAVYSVKY
jgi:hypothetical protein